MVVGKLSTAAFTRFNIIYTPKSCPKQKCASHICWKQKCVSHDCWKHKCVSHFCWDECSSFQPRNPGKSLQMISAHTCDLLYSSSTSNQVGKSNQGVWLKFWNKVKLKICKTRRGFEEFAHAEAASQCCSTNFFNPQATRSVLRFLWYYLFDVGYHIPLIIVI